MSIGHHDNPHAPILPVVAAARSPEPAVCTLHRASYGRGTGLGRRTRRSLRRRTLSALAAFSRADVSQAAAIVERYADVRIGIADASIVVLAGRYRTTRLLTLDERHFRVVAPLHADAFTILPAGRS
jgi:hypothetical protein